MVRGSILAVDDEEDVLELVRYNFHKEGFKVDTATTGEDALKKARANLPNVILLDIMLPGIDGIDVCRQLKQDSKTIAIPYRMNLIILPLSVYAYRSYQPPDLAIVTSKLHYYLPDSQITLITEFSSP